MLRSYSLERAVEVEGRPLRGTCGRAEQGDRKTPSRTDEKGARAGEDERSARVPAGRAVRGR